MRSRATRAVLWVLLIASAAGNTAASAGGLNTAVSLGFGTVTVLCIAALVAHHMRARGRQ
jgi:hypothetical protein